VEANAALAELANGVRRRQRGALRALFWAALAFGLVGAGLIARFGTLGARVTAAVGLFLIVASFWLRRNLERRKLSTPEGVAERLLVPADRELGERVLRALRLVERVVGNPGAGSEELARLHARRAVAGVKPGLLERRALRVARGRKVFAWVLGGLAFVTLTVDRHRVFEGLDVLLARSGRAPFAMTWLSSVSVSSQPPSYLRSPERALFPGNPSEEPQGSVVTVRGVPERLGRALLLTDGKREVPFTSDAAGGVVARWTLDSDAELRVGARFGQVLILEAESIPLRALADLPPRVVLEGAPKTLELAKLEQLELRYDVTDDHGLRQVDLVLRSGGREDRRVLGKLDGESRTERGAHALDPRDPFLRRMFLPVTVTVEARDNDVAGANKWGKSEPVTLLPPAVGEPEALRYKAIAEARDQVTDWLAALLEPAGELNAEQRAERRRAEDERAARVSAGLRDAATKAYAGLRVNAGAEAFLVGQSRALERRSPTAAATQRKVEEALLAVDAALRALGQRDAQTVAKRLGDVAEEAAEALKEARETEAQRQRLHRYQAAMTALQRGADQLVVLDALGQDLGSVAAGEIRRIRRGEQSGALLQAELAARHLAARLRRPMPSFSSTGKGGGVESGHGGGGGEPQGDATKAHDRFNQLQEEIERLVQEHRSGIDQVERALSEAEDQADLEGLRKEAAERAAKLRDKFAELPSTGGSPESVRGTSSLAREHGNAMAQRLERLMLEDSVESGRSARGLLEDAKRKAQQNPGFVNEGALEDAARELAEQLAWAEQALEQQREKASDRARDALSEMGKKEQEFARRAGNVAGQGAHGDASLPEHLLDGLEQAESVMREASRELEAGRGKRGLELQREAQRLLEQSDTGRLDQEDDRGRRDSERPSKNQDGKEMSTEADVPRPDDRKAAEEFRRRVLEGLSRDKGQRLSPAVQRYAEGLLQ
jgi:HAMP domain-containing protein